MYTEGLQWHPAIPKELISANEVHVWRADLDVSAIQLENLLAFLSADELARAGRFRFERDQKRFIVTRGILRKILGSYLDKNPDKLRFEDTSHGKPILATNSGYDTLRFNVSHSDASALFAITPARNIGIDIERVRNDVAIEPIVERFFSQGEISSLNRIHKNKRSELFFQYWTRKEAFLKATGKGISFPMEQCDVSLITGRSFSPIAILIDTKENSDWHVQDLFPGGGYAAAIAVEGDGLKLSCWHYSV